MQKGPFIAAMIALAAVAASFTAPSDAQPRPGIERLYILNCGEGVAGDISRWSPGVNEGKSMDFVDNCYLIKHAHGHRTGADTHLDAAHRRYPGEGKGHAVDQP
jgi:hypothetical protein